MTTLKMFVPAEVRRDCSQWAEDVANEAQEHAKRVSGDEIVYPADVAAVLADLAVIVKAADRLARNTAD